MRVQGTDSVHALSKKKRKRKRKKKFSNVSMNRLFMRGFILREQVRRDLVNGVSRVRGRGTGGEGKAYIKSTHKAVLRGDTRSASFPRLFSDSPILALGFDQNNITSQYRASIRR